MAENELKQVKIWIDDQGKLGKVKHPDRTVDKPDLPFSGKQYGWSLAGYKDTGLDLEAFFAQTVDVATNPPGDKQHLNTIQIRGPELVKLDVGYWGAYHRWREYPKGPKADADSRKKGIQREFGLVENHHVWLCRFNGKQSVPDTLKAFQDANAKQAAAVVNHLAPDMGIDIVAQTAVTDLRSATLDDQKLYVIFPDLHMPETLPDFPPMEKRHPNKDARKELRSLLSNAQHQSGLGCFNSVDQSEQIALQAYLEAIYVEPGGVLPQGPTWSVKAGIFGFRKTYYFTPEQFLAEKAIVDREIMLTSTWFYARGANWNRDAEDRDSAAAADDDGDPTPGVDLANLLCAVKKVRQTQGADISVIQVGDLYELWLNHEFLYRHFAVDYSYKVNEPGAYKAIWMKGTTTDDYQFRMDRDWQDPEDSPVHCDKRYVFNGWPKLGMLRRYKIGDANYAGLSDDELLKQLSLSAGQKTRLQQLLKDRVDRVRAYSLHDPQTSASTRLRAMGAKVLDFDHYWRRKNDQRKLGGTEPAGPPVDGSDFFLDQHGRREVLWNEMVLDLLADLNFRNIGGNHDGYRADPLLNTQLRAVDQAETVISEPGMWIEHSHRWDDFNRDGMAFGAGAANYVYYYFNNLCSKFAGWVEDIGAQQEQKCFVPGAALWFGIANFGDSLDWAKEQGIPSAVQPFGLYVSGHTHSASLDRVTFEFTPKPKPKPAAPGAPKAPPPQFGPKW